MIGAKIIFFFVLIAKDVKSDCNVNNSVVLTEMPSIDGSILQDGILYPPKHLKKTNISGEIKTIGCVCELKKCVRKCCPLNEIYVIKDGKKTCQEIPANNIIVNDGLDIYFHDNFKYKAKHTQFHFIFNQPCNDVYIEDEYPEYLQEDGRLYIKSPTDPTSTWNPKTHDEYCIETFLVKEPNGSISASLDVMACFAEEQDTDDLSYVARSIMMLLSCVFTVATLGVYTWLPELRNLHGKVLMAYLSCLFCGFLLFASLLLSLNANIIDGDSCVIFTIMIYFCMLASFFWLNIMCFDIWWTFSGKRGLSLERLSLRSRFLVYSLYAFGIPLVLTLLVAALEFTGLPAHPYLPMLKRQGCFFYGSSRIIYFYTPIFIICVANIVFCILTVMMIAKVKRETSVLKAKESGKHQRRKDTERFQLYVKLFVIMGINWILEVISGLFPGKIWILSDIYNMLSGVIIFILFVCKKKILRLVKRRYNQYRGNSVSRSQTTTSSRFSSREENIKLSTDPKGNNK